MVFQTKDADLATGSPGIYISTLGDAVTTAIVDNWVGGKLDHSPLYPLFPERIKFARSEVASDDFNRADNLDLGTNWIPVFTSCKIVSNQVQSTDTANVAVERYDAGLNWYDNHFSECTIIAIPTGGGVGPAVRCSPTAFTCYFAGVTTGSDGGHIYKVVAGAFTALATSAFTVAVNDILRLEVEGNILKVSKNGIMIFWIHDADILTGQPGIKIFTNGGALNTAILDNWKGGNLVPRPYYEYLSRPKLRDPQRVVGLYY